MDNSFKVLTGTFVKEDVLPLIALAKTKRQKKSTAIPL